MGWSRPVPPCWDWAENGSDVTKGEWPGGSEGGGKRNFRPIPGFFWGSPFGFRTPGIFEELLGIFWGFLGPMTIHNLYIFDRGGSCLFYSEWHRRRPPGIPQEEEFKLMFGMLFSLRSFVAKMSPTDMRDGFVSFHTSKYRLHYLETPSGLRLVLNTDLGVASAREALQHIYSNLFVELVVKNPLCPPRAPVQSLLFRQRLDAFVRSLPYFGPRNPNS